MKTQDPVAMAINAIASKHGGTITADQVIAEARNNPSSPLHNQFDWDIQSAAMEHWRHTARRLISRVRIVERVEREIVSCPVYVRDPSAAYNQQGYVAAITLRDDKAAAREALAYEIERARGCLRRVRETAVALNLGDELDDLLADLEIVRMRVDESAGMGAGAGAGAGA